MKYCKSCDSFLDETLFRKDRNRFGGLDGMCKNCRNISSKKRYHANPEPKKINSKKNQKGYQKKFYLKYKESGKKRAVDLNRRARKKNAIGVITKDVINIVVQSHNGNCFYCGKHVGQNGHIDHFIPLSRGGTNLVSNLRLSCKKCNSAKKDKMPEEFIIQVTNLAASVF